MTIARQLCRISGTGSGHLEYFISGMKTDEAVRTITLHDAAGSLGGAGLHRVLDGGTASRRALPGRAGRSWCSAFRRPRRTIGPVTQPDRGPLGFGFDLSVEVTMPKGSLWLRPLHQLSVLYGRNGCGKTTVIDALCDLFVLERGRSTDGRRRWVDGMVGHRSTAYVRLTVPVELYDAAVELVEEFASTTDIELISSLQTEGRLRQGWRFRDCGLGQGGINELINQHFVDAFEAWRERPDATDPGDELMSQAVRLQHAFVSALVNESKGRRMRMPGWPVPWLTSVKVALRDSIRDTYSEPGWRTTAGEVVRDFAQYGLDAPEFDHKAFDDRLFDQLGWSDLIALFVHRALAKLDWALRRPRNSDDALFDEILGDGATNLADVFPDPGRVVRSYIRALTEALAFPTIALRRDGEKWEVGFALPIPIAAEANSAVATFLCDALGSRSFDAELRRATVLDDELWITAYRINREPVLDFSSSTLLSAFNAPSSQAGFLALNDLMFGRLEGPPLIGITLDRPIDMEGLSRSLLAMLVEDRGAGVMLTPDSRMEPLSFRSSPR